MKVYADAGNWVTINGVHVLIGGNGKIVKGPAKFIGSTVADMKNVGKSASDRKEELKKRLSEKSGASSKSSKEAKKTGDTPKEKEVSGKSSKNIPTDSFFDRDNLASVDNEVLETAHYYKLMGLTSSKDLDSTDLETLTGVAIDYEKGPIDIETGKSVPIEVANARADYVLNKFDEIVNGRLNKSTSTSSQNKTESKSSDSKYPSGIETTAQKRAYTRAINSGMSSSEAKDSALGKATSNAQKYKSSFDKATTTSTMSQFYTKSSGSTKTKSTTRKTSSGKYNANNIPQVAGASKGVMRKTADYMNKGFSYDDAFDRALQDAGFGIGGRRGGFR